MKRPVILAWYASQFADLHAPLARILREKHGVDTVLCCYQRNNLPSAEHYDFDAAAFSEIVTVDDLMYPRQDGDLPPPDRFATELADAERSMSMSFVDALRCDRHLGIDFVTGADFTRSHYGLKTSWKQKLDIALRLSRFFQNLISRNNVAAVMAYPGDIGPAVLVSVAEGRGIPLQQLVRARTGKRFYLTRDRHNWPFGIEGAYALHLSTMPAVSEVPIPESPQAAKIYLSGFASRTTMRSLLKQIVQAFRREAGRLLKRRAVINREYFFLERLRVTWSMWRHRRRIAREPAVFPNIPQEQPYVFAPLAVEPESSLMAESQVCDNQLAAIDIVAKTLPSGWLLLVKEHPATTSPRPVGFWERIKAYPNIRVLAALEPGEAIALKARAVATINGSLGVQAACAGIPLLTFHPRYVGGLLPHAFLCRTYEDAALAMRKIRDGEVPPLAERKRAAAALMAGLDDLSYPLEDPHLLRGVSGGERVATEQVELIANVYMKLLNQGSVEQAAYAPTARGIQ